MAHLFSFWQFDSLFSSSQWTLAHDSLVANCQNERTRKFFLADSSTIFEFATTINRQEILADFRLVLVLAVELDDRLYKVDILRRLKKIGADNIPGCPFPVSPQMF